MNDEAESSAAGLLHANAATPDADAGPALDYAIEDPEEEEKQRKSIAKERRLDAKRKRVIFLDHLLRELDTLVFLEFITLYHLDCSFFWFFVRSAIQLTILTPLPDLQLARQQDEHKPFLPLILFHFIVTFLLHTIHSAPSAGEDTRGYLHGGLMIDFIGQQGPTSKWKLAGLDIGILLLQMVMVSAHVKRRELKKKLAQATGASTEGSSAAEGGAGEGATAPAAAPSNADREQDADSEERGVLRRTDTLSDTGADPDEEDALLPSSSEAERADAIDLLISGQAVMAEFTLIDTLMQSHDDYQTYRQTRTDTGASTGLSPTALRQLHTIRARFGVGGG